MVASARAGALHGFVFSAAIALAAPFPSYALLQFVEAEFDGVGGVVGLEYADSVAVSPDGGFVYVAGFISDAIAVFQRDSANGMLTFVSYFSLHFGYRNLAISPDGKHLYATGTGSSSESVVAVISRDPVTGLLTLVQRLRDGIDVNGLAGASRIALSPGGEHLYVVASQDDAVHTFARNSTTGTLTWVEALTDGIGGIDGLDSADDVKVSPDGTHVYTVGVYDNALTAFARDPSSGQLTQVHVYRDGVDGVDGLDSPVALTLSPDGAHVYVASGIPSDPPGDMALALFVRDAGTGELTYTSIYRHYPTAVDCLLNPRSPRVSPDGLYLYVVGWSQDAIAAYRRNLDTGHLTFIESRQDGVGGVDGLDGAHELAISPNGGHVYVTSRFDDAVAVFNVAGCPDGNLDSGEECDDGNSTVGDGCDAACAIEDCYDCSGEPSLCVPAVSGTACTDDADPCTLDECDGAGACAHPPGAPGVGCADDDNECTFDYCDGAGQCIHPPAEGPCDDGLECTDGACAAGVCVPGIWDPLVCALDDFRVYKAKMVKGATGFVPADVGLADQFETKVTSVVQPVLLGVPAGATAADIDVPEIHLACYKIRDAATDPKQSKFEARTVATSDRFGSLTLTVTRPAALCTPATKSLTITPPPLPAQHQVDNYKCYTVKVARDTTPFAETTAQVADQLEDKLVELIKPKLLCNPADKDGGGIPNPAGHLLCYSIRNAKTVPKQSRFMQRNAYTHDDFGYDALTLLKPQHLCVLATKTEL